MPNNWSRMKIIFHMQESIYWYLPKKNVEKKVQVCLYTFSLDK